MKALFTVVITISLLFLFPLKTFFKAPANARHTALLGQLVYGNGSTDKIVKDFLPETEDFYTSYIKTAPENTIIVESPFHFAFYALHGAQIIHGKNVLIGFWEHGVFTDAPPYYHANPDALKRLNNTINIFDDSSYGLDKEYIIIFHKDIQSESKEINDWYSKNYQHYLKQYLSKFGKPFYEDDFLAAFKYRKGEMDF
jgi:hypothetical protein